MVSILIFRSAPHDHDEYEVLAEATVREGDLDVRGRRADLVNRERQVYSERLNGSVKYEQDPEEWLRSLAESFRTAQVGALIIHDTGHPELEAPPDAVERIHAGAGVAR